MRIRLDIFRDFGLRSWMDGTKLEMRITSRDCVCLDALCSRADAKPQIDNLATLESDKS